MDINLGKKEKQYMELSKLNRYDDYYYDDCRCQECGSNGALEEYHGINNAMDIDDLKKIIKGLREELGAWISRADTIAKDRDKIQIELNVSNNTTIPKLKAKIKEYENLVTIANHNLHKNSINNKKDEE